MVPRSRLACVSRSVVAYYMFWLILDSMDQASHGLPGPPGSKASTQTRPTATTSSHAELYIPHIQHARPQNATHQPIHPHKLFCIAPYFRLNLKLISASELYTRWLDRFSSITQIINQWQCEWPRFTNSANSICNSRYLTVNCVNNN